MKDLKSYFQSNILAETTNSCNISENENSSLTMNADKKRQYDPSSDDSVTARPLRKTTKIRKSLKHTSANSEENFNRRFDDDASSESESKKKSNTCKKLRKKLSSKTKESTVDGDSSTPCEKKTLVSASLAEKQPHTSILRHFKGVEIRDCINSSINNETPDVSTGVCRRKRRKRTERNKSDSECTDSSENVFENRFEERPKTYSRKSASRKMTANNLLNYFPKTERSVVSIDRKLEDSPIDCLKQVRVVVDIHSPPKARQNKLKKIEMPTTCLSPVVKLFRTDAIKSLNLDAIEVIKPESTKLTPEVENDQDSDTSLVFSNIRKARVSSRKLLLDDSESESTSQAEDCKSNESKMEKNVSFSGLDGDNPVKSNSSIESGCALNNSKSSDCEDSGWKMRVQFMPKAKIKSKSKKPISNKVGSANSSEEEPGGKNKEKAKNENTKKTDNKQTGSKNKEDIIPSKHKKLAPLFCKQYKNKKKLDNIVNFNDEAKRLFLCSGLPEIVQKKFDEQKTIAIEEEKYACYRFPFVSHIQQKTNDFVWNLPDVELTWNIHKKDFIVPHCDSLSSYINKDVKYVKNRNQVIDFDMKNEIAALKKMEPTVNVADLYASVKRLNTEAENTDSICWTDKYKPSNYGDLIGNAFSLMKLKEWIESHKRLRTIRSDCDSSSEEFFDSDDSSCSSRKDNIAILVGPSGCGKTCAVYMLAKEQGFKVLEVNAGLNRNGKRLLDELLEATQSHQVKRATIFDEAAKNKKSKGKTKTKKSVEQRERKTMSLILIEDADILFEDYDEGFLAALSTLAKQSKRPLIFIVNDINYPHLAKYRNSLILRFEYPSRSQISVWLKLIALTEGVKLPDAMLVDLFHVAGLDVRKSLLQLQLLISSKHCYLISEGAQSFYLTWCQQLTQCEKGQKREEPLPKVETGDRYDDLFSPKKETATVAIVDNKSEELIPCEASKKDERANQQPLENHAKFLDSVALLGCFESNQEQRVHPCENDDSLEEDWLSSDICSQLEQILFSDFDESDLPVSFSKYYTLIRKNSRIKSVYQNALSNLKIPLSDSYAKYCDFLPTLRSISRIEETKQSNQLKRTSRFFSYLKSVNINVSDQEIEFLRKSMI